MAEFIVLCRTYIFEGRRYQIVREQIPEQKYFSSRKVICSFLIHTRCSFVYLTRSRTVSIAVEMHLAPASRALSETSLLGE